MEELIRITEQNGKQAVSARELHTFLESKKQFADWIKDRIRKYDLVENVDFVSFSLNSEKGRPTIEYALTLDCAKELSMVEGNAKGKIARKYFIERDNKLKAIEKQLSPAEALLQNVQILVEQEKRITNVEKDVLVLKAKATTRPEYFTVAGYCRLQGVSASTQMCISLGRKASTLCKQRNIPIDEVPDTRWGKVGSYPANVLEEVFAQPAN